MLGKVNGKSQKRVQICGGGDSLVASMPMSLPAASHMAAVISVTLTMHLSINICSLPIMFLLLYLDGLLGGQRKENQCPRQGSCRKNSGLSCLVRCLTDIRSIFDDAVTSTVLAL